MKQHTLLYLITLPDYFIKVQTDWRGEFIGGWDRIVLQWAEDKKLGEKSCIYIVDTSL